MNEETLPEGVIDPLGADLADQLIAEAVEEITEVPPPAIPPPEMPFQMIRHTWYGTDGSVWDLTDPDDGIFLTQENIEGLHRPPADYVHRESPSVPGASYHGYRIRPRKILWPVYIYSDESSDHYLDLDRRFWKSLQIGKVGTWRVTLPDGSYRELRFRSESNNDGGIAHDPARFGWFKYAVEGIADVDPFWTRPQEIAGSQVTFEQIDDPDSNFFGGAAGVGPDFKISPSRAQRVRSYTNDGDEPVYPTIRVTGPMSSVKFSLGEREYTVACNLTDRTQWIEIRTNPLTFGVTDHAGRNRISSLSAWTFYPFEAGVTTPIEVVPDGDGGGTVVFDAPPLYHRAW